MPILFIGLGVLALGAGGFLWWRHLGSGAAEAPPAAGGDKSPPLKQGDETVKADAVALGESAARSSTESAAENPSLDLPEKLATEPQERFPGSPEVALHPDVKRVQKAVFLDSSSFDPALDQSTLSMGSRSTVDLDAPFVDTLSQPRDLANAPLSGQLGDLEAELT